MASNWTLSVAVGMLPHLSPITSTSYILDNVCVTGLVTDLLKSHYPALRMIGTDATPGTIEACDSKIATTKWFDTITSSICDSRTLTGIENEFFTHVITNFDFPPDLTDRCSPMKAAREIWRLLKPGGMADVSIWKAAARRISPNERPYAWTLPSDWSDAGWLQETKAEIGFGDNVTVKHIGGSASAESLERLVANMMCDKGMFCRGHSEEEFDGMAEVLGEELKKWEAWYEDEEGFGIIIDSWVAFATK
ncbi:uncharacterized protein RCO7_00541 [Rhynchosporium graminicola]|uniref:Methyltransferase domain-containing protein n=1 Tax=Rhynchosporium graminicola TaxID=2792576 RepID=A0A1E1KMM4_9HELO|nr:uncharacterized protein RCO7_00541 [Rhynchosporium commune]